MCFSKEFRTLIAGLDNQCWQQNWVKALLKELKIKTVIKCTREKGYDLEVLSVFHIIAILGNEMLLPHNYSLNN